MSIPDRWLEIHVALPDTVYRVKSGCIEQLEEIYKAYIEDESAKDRVLELEFLTGGDTLVIPVSRIIYYSVCTKEGYEGHAETNRDFRNLHKSIDPDG
jgi:hypothetical protein